MGWVLGAYVLGWGPSASASDAVLERALTSTAAATATVSPGRRLAAVGAALIPGLVVHGAGHWVLGETATGFALLELEIGALALTISGLIGLGLSGASRRVVAPLAVLTLGSAGVLGGTFLADLYGVLAAGRDLAVPAFAPAALELEVGVLGAHDPTLELGPFAMVAAEVWLSRYVLRPAAWGSIAGRDHVRGRLEAGYRLLGPIPGDAPAWAHRLDLLGAVTHHRYGPERFALTTAEVAVAGRYELARFAPTLRGAFAEGAVGAALVSHRYFEPATSDAASLLLLRMGFGIYLGLPREGWGEVQLYYDHRHDGFAAGLKLPGLASGVLGHVGLSTRLWFTRTLGLRVELATGSAHVGQLSLLFRPGGDE